MRGPRTGAVTSGRDSSQPIATVTGSSPRSAQSCSKRSSAARCGSTRSAACRTVRPGTDSRCLRRAPESAPKCSGEYGSTPRPSSAAAGSTSSSACRVSRLYLGCSETRPSWWRRSAAAWARARCQPAKFDEPAYRILPWIVRVSRACQISSQDVVRSTWCSWKRSIQSVRSRRSDASHEAMRLRAERPRSFGSSDIGA